MSNPILDVIARKGWCVTDGATGSNFFGRGLEAGYPPELGASSDLMRCFGFTESF